MEPENLVNRNSELLYLFDARMANPNGDPDEENRPRMDYEAGRVLVSDVRLKRYLRDYWLELGEEEWKGLGYGGRQDVWVRRLPGENGGEQTVSAKQRVERLAQEFGKKSAKEAAKDPGFRGWLLGRLVDVRLFGATIPIGEEEEKGGDRGRGGSLTLTGPVQFTWGYSLNRAELLPSPTISSHFAGREGEKGEYGTFGKDWRVKYALIAFYGTVSAWRARHTGLTWRDLRLLDRSLVQALPLMATTRSKLGQTPRLYLRVEYKDDRTLLGDLRARIRLQGGEGLEGLEGVRMDFEPLVGLLLQERERIGRVVLWSHEEFADGQRLGEALRGLPLEGLP